MKNKRSLIINSVVLLLCVLTFVFLAFDAFGGSGGWQTLKSIWSASGDGIIKALALPVLMLVVLTCILTVATILKILAHVNVIKCEKFNKIVRKIAYVTAILIVYTYIIVIIQVCLIEVMKDVLGWGSIVNIVIGIIAAGLVIANRFLNKCACKKACKLNQPEEPKVEEEPKAETEA